MMTERAKGFGFYWKIIIIRFPKGDYLEQFSRQRDGLEGGFENDSPGKNDRGVVMADSRFVVASEELLTHAGFVRALARRLLQDEQKAEDVAQETWMAAMKLPRRPDKPLRHWLAGTARNLARRVIRSESSRRNRERAATRPEATRPTDEIVEQEATRRRVVSAVLSLDEPYRSAVLFRFYDDMPPREIARHLDLPVETVKTRIQRGLARLRERLDAEYGGDGSAWCAALLPLAGIKGAATAGAASGASVLTGILAMTFKTKIACIIIALSFVAGVFMIWQLDAEDQTPAEITLATVDEDSVVDTAMADDSLPAEVREQIAPEENDIMPATYREALGGMKGRLVAWDGMPVPGEDVTLHSFCMEDLLPEQSLQIPMHEYAPEITSEVARTEEDGTFLFTEIHPYALRLLTVDTMSGQNAVRFVDAQPEPGLIVDIGDVMLEKGCTLHGTVLDDAGNPVEGAHVRALQAPAEIYQTGLFGFKPGCSFLMKWGIFAKDNYVVDPPAPLMTLLKNLPVHETNTRKDGTFSLNHTPFDHVVVIVQKDGFETAYTHDFLTTNDGEGKECTFRLSRGVSVRGRVVDNAGRPAPGVEVRLGKDASATAMSLLHPPVFTDEDGRFTLNHVAHSPTCCALRRIPFDVWSFHGPFDPSGSELEFRLPETYDLNLEVVRKDGSPIGEIDIKIKEYPFLALIPMWVPEIKEKDWIETGSGKFVINDLVPGRYELLITVPGFGTLARQIRIKDRSVFRKYTMESPDSSLCVKVRSKTENTPLGWADLILVPEIDRDRLDREDPARQLPRTGEVRESHSLSPHDVLRARTDESGQVVFAGLSKGKYTLTVSHPGFVVEDETIDVNGEQQHTILMSTGGILEGMVVMDSGKTPVPYTLILERSGSGLGDLRPRITITDSDGYFRVENLNSDWWRIELQPRMLNISPFTLMSDMSPRPLVKQNVEIEEGKTTTIELYVQDETIQPNRLTGVVSLNGIPAPNVRVVMVLDGEIRESTTGADGVYTLGFKSRGSASIRFYIPIAEGNPSMRIERDLKLDKGVTTEDFDFATGCIHGKVVYFDDGSPACGVQVKASMTVSPEEKVNNMREGLDWADRLLKGEQPSGYVSYVSPVEIRIRTDMDGCFRIEHAPIGYFTLETAVEGMGCQPAHDVEARMGQAIGPVKLILFTPVPVRGHVRLTPDYDKYGLQLIVVPEEEASIENLMEVCASILFPFDTGGSRMVDVDSMTGAFEVSGLMPGSYESFLLLGSRERTAEKWHIPLIIPLRGFEVPVHGITELYLDADDDAPPEEMDLLEELKKQKQKN